MITADFESVIIKTQNNTHEINTEIDKLVEEENKENNEENIVI